MNNDNPRYLEILAIVDWYSYFLEEWLKEFFGTDKRTGLDRMIDNATGYDKKMEEDRLNELKKIIVSLKTKAKFEKIIDHPNLPVTLKILEKVRGYRGEMNITKP
jgi:hypothetical protein